ncbi:MAG TPA: YceI family protein [Micromonosporaceae bacterium]|jgi:polyisoprenoid-binding protein YceI
MTSSTTELATRDWNDATIPTPGTFSLDVAHSRVGFVVRHLMSKVRGVFKEFAGEIIVAENPLESRVTATMQATSIDTGSPDRDNHLRTGDFFEAEKYPTLSFRSTRVVNASDDTFTVVGDLTIKGVTREVELAVEFGGVARNPWGAEVVAFTATAEIDREDFGISWNQALETGGVLVGRKVKIEIEAEAIRQA